MVKNTIQYLKTLELWLILFNKKLRTIFILICYLIDTIPLSYVI
jgi:hypothetical protein